MKVAVTSTGKDLDADLDPRFGRAAYFLIVDKDTLAFDIVENTQNLNLPQGAGIQASQTVIGQHIDALITGNCGPKAFKMLSAAGIDIMLGAKGSVRDAVAQFNSGELENARQANVDGHWV